MDEQWKQTMEELNRVWDRVNRPGGPPPPPRPGMGPPPPPPPPPREDTDTLARLIRMEIMAQRQYRELAARTRGRAAQSLSQLAAGSGRQARRMQEEYYLRTGDTLSPPPKTDNRRRGNLQEDLRRAWVRTGEGEREYLNADADTRSARLRELYADGAEEKRRQQRTLRDLLRRMF